jgi:hypothetical protein
MAIFTYSKAFSLVEVLGVVAVVSTLAVVSVVSIKNTVQAGQKAGAQKELQHLNSALQNFRSAGGVMEPGVDARGAIDALQGGVELSGSDFTSLSTDPAMSREIDGETYNLMYDEEDGFTYGLEDGSGELLSGSGQVAAAQEPFPFDVNDPAAAANALNELATLEPGSEEYNALLAGLNAANMLGTISNEAMAGAGLISQDGQWVSPGVAYEVYANEAQALLDSGSTWADLSPVQQEGYANVYPELAVATGGAAALNLMGPNILTPELVTGFVLDEQAWVAPVINGPTVNSSGLTSADPDWAGWGQPFPVVRVTDPLLPGEVIGWVTPHVTWYTITSSNLIWAGEEEAVETTSGPYAHVYYTAVTNPDVEGVTNNAGSWTTLGSSSPTIFSSGGGSSVTVVGGSPVPEGETLLTGVTFASATGGAISVIPTRDGIVVPEPTPAPSPTPSPSGGGGLPLGGGGGFPLGGGF